MIGVPFEGSVNIQHALHALVPGAAGEEDLSGCMCFLGGLNVSELSKSLLGGLLSSCFVQQCHEIQTSVAVPGLGCLAQTAGRASQAP